MPTADLGTGTTVAFLTSNFQALVTSVDWSGISRVAVETTNLATSTAKTFVPGDLYDGGTIRLGIQFDPDDFPPITSAAEMVKVTYPIPSGGSTAANWSASAFVTTYGAGVTVEGLMSANLELKVSGAITRTAST